MAKEVEEGNSLETYLRPLILKSNVCAAWDAQECFKIMEYFVLKQGRKRP